MLYNQNSTALMICSLIVAAWYMSREVINDKSIYSCNILSTPQRILNHNPISCILESEDNKTTKLFNLLKTLPSTIIDGVYEAVEKLFIGIIDCFLFLFELINKGVKKNS